MSDKQDLIRLCHYVSAASDLAEGLRSDILKNSRISSGTVVNLGKFFKAARAVEHLLTEVQSSSSDIQ